MLEGIRSAREVIGEFDGGKFLADVTIFLGLYNAEPYLKSLEHQLSSQESQVKIVVVDNMSTDNTWALIQDWLRLFPGQIKLARNPVNLGGTGTLFANLDLIPTRWVVTFHQDDFYKPSHVRILSNGIARATPSQVGFATDMGSMTSDGHAMTSPPRASWTLPNTSIETMFLSNLRLHNFPFPAAALRVEALLRNSIPWHSTTFPDTELVLGWVLRGELVHLEGETMLYRENPES